MFSEYGDFGYDQISVHPLDSGYFSTTSGAESVGSIRNTEDILREKVYMLEANQRSKYKIGVNNDNL